MGDTNHIIQKLKNEVQAAREEYFGTLGRLSALRSRNKELEARLAGVCCFKEQDHILKMEHQCQGEFGNAKKHEAHLRAQIRELSTRVYGVGETTEEEGEE